MMLKALIEASGIVNTPGIKLTISSEQVRAARALIRWEQKDLAEASEVSLPTIKRLEVQPGLLAAQSRTVDAIRRALEDAGVIFVDANGEGAGVRLRKGAARE